MFKYTENTYLKKILNSKKAIVQLHFKYLLQLTDLESEIHYFMKKMKDSKEHEWWNAYMVSSEKHFLQTRMTLHTILHSWKTTLEKASKPFPNFILWRQDEVQKVGMTQCNLCPTLCFQFYFNNIMLGIIRMWNSIVYLRKREIRKGRPTATRKKPTQSFPWSVTIGSNNFIKLLRNLVREVIP